MAVHDSWVCANHHVNPDHWLTCRTCHMSRTGAGQAVRCQVGHLNPAGTRVCQGCNAPIGVVSRYCGRGHYIPTGATVCADCGGGPSPLHTYGGGSPSSSQPTEPAADGSRQRPPDTVRKASGDESQQPPPNYTFGDGSGSSGTPPSSRTPPPPSPPPLSAPSTLDNPLIPQSRPASASG